MADDYALKSILATYQAKEDHGMTHGHLVMTAIEELLDRVYVVCASVKTCTNEKAQFLAQKYLEMVQVETADVDKRVPILEGFLASVEGSAKLGTSAVAIANSFVHTTTMVIVALIVSAHRYLSFAQALVDQSKTEEERVPAPTQAAAKGVN